MNTLKFITKLSRPCGSLCNKINCDDKKVWKSIDKVLNGNSKCVIQLLIKTDGSYEFDDKEIS